MGSGSNSASSSSLVRNVESFVYQDTAHGFLARDSQKEGTREKPGPEHEEQRHSISEAELVRIVADAHEKGRQEGESRALSNAEDNLARERKRIAEVLAQFEKERSEYFSKVEADLIHLALGIAAKILHRESQVDRMAVAGVVKVALEKLKQSASITIRVPQGEAVPWQQYFQDISNLKIVEDASLASTDCMLETDVGSAHVGFDAQLKEVEQGFFDLLAQRPR
jgi:flagellar assembly protein FliH